MKLVLAILVAVAFWQLSVTPTQAINDPPLFSCVVPVGTLVADNNGTHGIPGDSGSFIGNDKVYRVDNDHVLQCFCPDDRDSGIQSNWWNVSSLSQADIDFFVRRGWVLVPNGRPWGLAENPYLVRNDSFSCGGIGGGDFGRGGYVLGATTLAGTGSSDHIVMYALVGLGCILLAYRLARR